LNGNHTVFGEVISEEDMAVVNSIVQGDMIKQVTIEGETSDLFEKTASRVEEWNKKIDQSFPDLDS
ncbi:MAG: peptidylprolyl isomerase, partial [Desulfobulbaceae bacterium]|nr:peptidylprolyl isomerase [Desulfobulbaceae bacterium]